MDNIFEGYVENLVNECMQTSKFAYLPAQEKKQIQDKIRNQFYQVTINTLLDQLSDDQLLEIKDLPPDDPKMQEALSKFAASIPGFAVVLEEKLKKEMDTIMQNGQIPQS